MTVSMLFSKRPMILVIPSSFFPTTVSDAPHLSLLSVQRGALGMERGQSGEGGQKETRTGVSQIDLIGEETEVCGDRALLKLTGHWRLVQV